MNIEVNQRVGIVATSGAGKSNAAYTILEKLRIQKYPIVIMDHKNEYGGLPKTVILYASQTNAAALVNELKITNASVTVFMKDLTLKKKRKWISKFLLEAQRVSRDIPIMIVIEEARLYAPQSGNPSSKEPIMDLAQGGRSEGYGCLIITQRTSALDKNVLGSLTDLIIMRHVLPKDIEYLEDFVGRDKAQKVKHFQIGHAYHVDLERSQLEEIQFTKNENKKGGSTPQPTQVEPQAIGLKQKPQKDPKNPQWIVIGLVAAAIIIFTIIGIVLFFMMRKTPDDQEDQ